MLDRGRFIAASERHEIARRIRRKELFDDPRIRWDGRLKVYEREDFFLQLNHHSPYEIAYYPGFECDPRQDSPASYQLYRKRSEMERLVREKWGVDAHLELGTRFVSFI